MKRIYCLFFMAMLFIAGCPSESPAPEQPEPEQPAQIPVETRSFYMGVVPTPKTEPETTFEDLAAAYQEAGDLGEVVMVWAEPSGVGQYERLQQNKVIDAVRVYGLKPVVTLTFASLEEVPGAGLQYTSNLSDLEFRARYKEEARKIAEEFQPEYFSLGNEINDYFYLHQDDLDDYLTLYDETYAEIKKVSPNTKVFVVFSYTHLVENEQWELIETFDQRADLIGLTTYPWKHFNTPDEIDSTYYTRIGDYTTKPIAFTEIGWPSTNSESEQAEFLDVFINRTKEMNLEMVNWLFLREVALEGTMASVTEEETQTIALKKADGTEKEVYAKWKELSEKEPKP